MTTDQIKKEAENALATAKEHIAAAQTALGVLEGMLWLIQKETAATREREKPKEAEATE